MTGFPTVKEPMLHRSHLLPLTCAILLGGSQAAFAITTEGLVVNLSERDWQIRSLADSMGSIQDHGFDLTLRVWYPKTGVTADLAAGETLTLHRGEAITLRVRNRKPMSKYSQCNRLQLLDDQGRPGPILQTVLWVPPMTFGAHADPVSFHFAPEQVDRTVLVQTGGESGPVLIVGNEASPAQPHGPSK